MATYRHNHTVPKGYLRLFADLYGRVTTHFTKTGDVKTISARDAAVRTAFYVYRQANGDRTTELEESFQEVETKAAPVMRTIQERWPLDDEDRGVLVQFLAVQFVRSPAWRDRFEQRRDLTLAREAKRDRALLGDDLHASFTEEMRSDETRVYHLKRQIPLIGSLLGSMSWTLLDFGSDRLLTSDHPLAPIGMDQATQEAVPSYGLANIIEARFPVSPRHGLLLCWRDEPDHHDPIHGHQREARAFNHAVHAQAELQWFHRPGKVPTHTMDRTALATVYHPRYGLEAARSSEDRRRTLAYLDTLTRDQRLPRDTFRVHRTGRGPGPATR